MNTKFNRENMQMGIENKDLTVKMAERARHTVKVMARVQELEKEVGIIDFSLIGVGGRGKLDSSKNGT